MLKVLKYSSHTYFIINGSSQMALEGIKVIEMQGRAPGMFCGSIFADFGATVTVIQKLTYPVLDVMSNGKRSISINLQTKEGVDILKKMCATSDVLLDTYRPGYLQHLGLGPEQLLKENPRLIYATLTSYGQYGYYVNKAAHDINFVAMSGILSRSVRNDEPPRPPSTILLGGSVTCALGILLALLERAKSGRGQIIDASMTEGIAYIASFMYKVKNLLFCNQPGSNINDGGSAYYATYKTKDNKFMAVGAVEPHLYSKFLIGLALSEDIYIQTATDICKKKFQEVFLTKTQEEWCRIFDKLDACVTPVLSMDDIDTHKYHLSRKSFYRDNNNIIVPEPTPKLSLTPGIASGKKPAPKHGEHTIAVLKELGYTHSEIQELIMNNCIYAYISSHL